MKLETGNLIGEIVKVKAEVTGLLVIGHWLLVIGYWSLVTVFTGLVETNFAKDI